MFFYNYFLKYKTLFMELLLRYKKYFYIFNFLGIDSCLSLNEDENIKSNKIDIDKMKVSEILKPIIDNNSNNNNVLLPSSNISIPSSSVSIPSTSTSSSIFNNNNLSNTMPNPTSSLNTTVSETNNVELNTNIKDKISNINIGNVNNNVSLEKHINSEIEKKIQRINNEFEDIRGAFEASASTVISLAATSKASNKTKVLATSTIAAVTYIAPKALRIWRDTSIENLKKLDLTNNRPPSPGNGPFNFTDTNTNEFIHKIYSFINNFDINLFDIDTQLLIYCFLLLLSAGFFIFYLFFFVVSPSIFNTIKDILPIKVKEYLISYINFNRKISVPFVIIGFICIVICWFIVIISLGIIIYLKYLQLQ